MSGPYTGSTAPAAATRPGGRRTTADHHTGTRSIISGGRADRLDRLRHRQSRAPRV